MLLFLILLNNTTNIKNIFYFSIFDLFINIINLFQELLIFNFNKCSHESLKILTYINFGTNHIALIYRTWNLAPHHFHSEFFYIILFYCLLTIRE